jgi:hypothetical protein
MMTCTICMHIILTRYIYNPRAPTIVGIHDNISNNIYSNLYFLTGPNILKSSCRPIQEDIYQLLLFPSKYAHNCN